MRKGLYVFIATLLTIGLFFIPIQAENHQIIWIGDSRFVGMSQSVQTSSNDVFIAEGGMGYTWFVNTAIPQANTKLKKGDKIVIGMGANGFGADSYLSTVNNLVGNEWKDCDVYFMSVNPFVDDKVRANGMAGTDADVHAFNKIIKEGLDKKIKYIDTYSEIKEGIETKTQDGVHYTVECYQEIYDLVRKALNGQTLAEEKESNKNKECGKETKSTITGTFNENTKFEDIDWDEKFYTYNTDGINGHPNVCKIGSPHWPGNYGSCGPGYPSMMGAENKMICASYAYSRFWAVNYPDEKYPLPGDQDATMHKYLGNKTGEFTISRDSSDITAGSVVGVTGHDIFIEEKTDDYIIISEANLGKANTGNKYGWRCKKWKSFEDYCSNMGMSFVGVILPNK